MTSIGSVRPTAPKANIKFEYDAHALPDVKDLVLKGSFDPATGLYDDTWNGGKGIPMTKKDGVYTATVPLQWGQTNKFTWGVEGKLNGVDRQWLILSDDNPTFQLWNKEQRAFYAPVSNHLYGVHNKDNQAQFRTWSPALTKNPDYKLHVDLYGADGQLQKSLPMEPDVARGDWSLSLPNWKALEGSSYRYSARNDQGEILKTADGKPVEYADPVSRFLQGQQRGVERIFVDPILGFETGWYDDSGSGGPNYIDNPQWGRFSVNGYSNADSIKLVLRDEQGKQLSKAQLLEKLGEPKFTPYDQAEAKDKHDVDVLTRWTMGKTKPITDYVWLQQAHEDGSIDLKKMQNPTNGANWLVAVNNFPNLVGLKYEFQVRENGQLVGVSYYGIKQLRIHGNCLHKEGIPA